MKLIIRNLQFAMAPLSPLGFAGNSAWTLSAQKAPFRGPFADFVISGWLPSQVFWEANAHCIWDEGRVSLVQF